MLTRKHVARAERDTILRRWVLIGTAFVAISVVGLVAYGIYQSRVVQPKEPVAIVNGDPILTEEFRGRVRLIQYNLLTQYSNLRSILDFVGDDPQTAAAYQSQLDQVSQQLGNPLYIGTTMLQVMIEERLIQQEANARGIEVTEQDVDKWLEESFGYFRDPTQVVATPTPIPDATPGPTATPFTRELFDLSYQAYLTNVGRYGVEEPALRADASARLYRERLLAAFEPEVPHEQEQVWARHILVADEQTAQDLLQQIQDGADWTALAAEFSTDASNKDQGGDLGWFPRGAMVDPFEQAAFDAEVGDIVGPLETDFGWHLIEVLGHEMRELDSGTYQQLLSRYLDDWLSVQGEAAEIEIFDYWSDRVPSPPLPSSG